MKSNQTLKVLFWHRKSKADSKGLAPIICRISIDGKDVEFSAAQKVHIEHWNVETKKVVKSGDFGWVDHCISEKSDTLFRTKLTR